MYNLFFGIVKNSFNVYEFSIDLVKFIKSILHLFNCVC